MSASMGLSYCAERTVRARPEELSRIADNQFVAPRSKPIALIVRRGAIRRFHKLKEKTADLPVEVLWDRRESDRRAAADKESAKRRSGDRRQPPPFTWEASDFVVAAAAKAKEEVLNRSTRD